jgi:nucleoside-diphosphate-sugar epimerase
MERILIIGANGQIGSELVSALAATTRRGQRHRHRHRRQQRLRRGALRPARRAGQGRAWPLIAEEGITQVYQLAALLSATGEQAPLKAWTLNMDGLLNILEVARERGEAGKPLKVFWPSSIAAFGPNTPARTPRSTR